MGRDRAHLEVGQFMEVLGNGGALADLIDLMIMVASAGKNVAAADAYIMMKRQSQLVAEIFAAMKEKGLEGMLLVRAGSGWWRSGVVSSWPGQAEASTQLATRSCMNMPAVYHGSVQATCLCSPLNNAWVASRRAAPAPLVLWCTHQPLLQRPIKKEQQLFLSPPLEQLAITPSPPACWPPLLRNCRW